MASLKEFEDLEELDELRRATTSLQRQLRRAKSKNDDLREAVRQGAKDALMVLGPPPKVPAPKKVKRNGRPEVALWHMTDWQGSKVTTSYNSEIMRERVLAFCDKAIRLTEIQRAAHPVDDATLMFGGDMIEGLFNYPSQPYEIDSTLFEQYTFAARLVADVVRRALAAYRNVQVITEWGNHGRIGSKRAAVVGSDNVDRMVYELAQALVGDEPRVTWQGSEEDTQRVEIGAYRALLIHGDEIGRNGYAAPGTIVTHVAKWKSGSYPWPFRDCYLGHRHTHSEWALPDGKGAVYMTGSIESDNRYALNSMAAAASPSQRVHFIDPIKGRVTAQFRVWLDE